MSSPGRSAQAVRRSTRVCRRLQSQGRLHRYVGPRSKIVNQVDGSSRAAPAPPAAPPAVPRQPIGELISEDQVKAAVRDHLAARGLHVQVRWGRDRGVDITASGPHERWIIEAKGEVASPQQQGNYFLGALGELIQRMDDPYATYALALPENPRFRGLVDRLPALARHRLNLTVLRWPRCNGHRRPSTRIGRPIA